MDVIRVNRAVKAQFGCICVSNNSHSIIANEDVIFRTVTFEAYVCECVQLWFLFHCIMTRLLSVIFLGYVGVFVWLHFISVGEGTSEVINHRPRRYLAFQNVSRFFVSYLYFLHYSLLWTITSLSLMLACYFVPILDP